MKISLLTLVGCLLLAAAAVANSSRPNIVYIMADDLGYGDIQCLAPETSKIPTPHADRLASEGLTFRDAHSGSSVCTPTRYGLLTGRYSWRTRLQNGVVQGFAPCLIAEDQLTAAELLKGEGYHTGIVGKWHLNFLYLDPSTGEEYLKKKHKTPPVGAKIPDGPIHRGFDYFHGFHHAGNMKAVIEDDEVIAHDDVINMLPRLAEKSAAYIDSRADSDTPFFLYVPLGSPHTPIVPTALWQGKSGINPYADFVMETDDAIGTILEALDRNGFRENTLVVFTSDNGCSKAAKIPEMEDKGHFPSAHLRGSKADLWEGGHRVPFLLRWPATVEAGTVCDELICHTDLIATAAELVGVELPEDAGGDSVSFAPILSGQAIESTRAGVIHHSISGHFAYRQGPWKLLLAKASGGWTSPTEKQAEKGASKGQLYNLEADPGETENLYESQPERVAQLLELLKEDIRRGRSTAGKDLPNDIEDIVLWKTRN